VNSTSELAVLIREKFVKKKLSTGYFLVFSLIFLGGYGLLWWETNWKVLLAVFLISYGILLQVDMGFVSKDEPKKGR